jgi:trigger factor
MGEIKKTLLRDGELEKMYEIRLAADYINLKSNETLEKKQKTYRANGFRPGKVPLELIKKKEGTAIFFATVENLINGEAFNIARDNGYDLIRTPKVDIKTMAEGEDAVVNVEYALRPTMPDVDWGTIAVDEYRIIIRKEDVENSVAEIMKDFKDWARKDGVAANGDAVKINFTGTINGEKFDGGAGEDYHLEIGSHSFIGNFEEQLIGKGAGDRALVKVKFPDDYHSSKLAGKDAEFDVEIIEVLEAKKVSLTDEFTAKNFGISAVDNFKKIIEKEIDETHKLSAKNRMRNDVMEKIKNVINFPIPDSLIEEKFQILLKEEKKDNLRKGKEEEINEEKLRKDAAEIVRMGLFLTKVGADNNITVSKNDIDSRIVKNAMKMRGQEQKVIEFYRKNPQAMEDLGNNILEDKIIDHILNNVTKNVKEITAEEYINILKVD